MAKINFPPPIYSIPEITDPLGKGWGQPNRENIKLSLSHAWMDQKSFDQLLNYQSSDPTGVYSGKMWKRKIRIGQNRNSRWYLIFFDKERINGKGQEVCPMRYFRIGIEP